MSLVTVCTLTIILEWTCVTAIIFPSKLDAEGHQHRTLHARSIRVHFNLDMSAGVAIRHMGGKDDALRENCTRLERPIAHDLTEVSDQFELNAFTLILK
jgi:hypothetical protein